MTCVSIQTGLDNLLAKAFVNKLYSIVNHKYQQSVV